MEKGITKKRRKERRMEITSLYQYGKEFRIIVERANYIENCTEGDRKGYEERRKL